jgi:pimeloyl-ACP methyl ester carboxylesterase
MMRLLKWGLIALIVAIAGLCAYGATYHAQTDAPAGMQGQFVDVMGARTRYLQVGSGPDVLLIHGSPGSLEDWQPVIAALAPNFRVTAYDRPGNGYTASTGRYDYGYNADFALDLVRKLDLHDVVVAGHSYGGAVALAMALQTPSQVKSYVVIDSSLYHWARPKDPMYHVLAMPLLGTGIARLAADAVAPKKIRASLESMFPAGTMPPGFVEAHIPIWSQPKVTVSLANEALGSPAALNAMSPRYKQITQPVFMVGQADDPIRRDNAESLQRDLPSAQVSLVSGTGHFIQFTKTDVVVDLIRKAAAR